jgi:adenylate kinase family enzyme
VRPITTTRENIASVKRVAVVGSGGAGKTTFASELSRRTGLPVVHLDHLYWKPGWVETPSDEWRIVQDERLTADEWIVDGNYSGTFDVRFRRVDTIIVLALSRWRCLSRVLRRTISNHGRSVQAPGCPEHLDLKFLKWVWRYQQNSRPLLDVAIAENDGVAKLIELKTPHEVTLFLESLGPDRTAGNL